MASIPRLFAIGDIHGNLAPLDALLEHIQLNSSDILVTLGDYIDHGPDSAGVVQRLIELKDRCTLIPLRGNHESMLIESLNGDPVSLAIWKRAGGDACLNSYGVSDPHEIPQTHQNFLKSTLLYYETESHIFAHAGVSSDEPLTQQPESILLWLVFDRILPHISGKTIICGHTPQPSGLPAQRSGVICIDTDILSPSGFLSCLEVQTGTVLCADSCGQINSIFDSARSEK